MTPSQMRETAHMIRTRIAGRDRHFPALCRYVNELEREADRLAAQLATRSQRGNAYPPRRPVMMGPKQDPQP